jgi:signal transduction histidine kinase
VVVGMRDLYVFRINPSYGHGDITLIRYSALLFGVALAWIVMLRFRSASVQARELMHSLHERVALKEAELKATYQTMQGMLSERARSGERTRILRDMHDGVGTHLSSAIRQLQQGPVQSDELMRTLRDALDQLKLSIDVLTIPPGDVNTLLASLRYRLEPRLRLAGLELVWAVQPLPLLPWLDSARMRHLQFVLFEVLANILQHAHARHLRIQAQADGPALTLEVSDDGQGFVVPATGGKGLTSLRERCGQLGAMLEVETSPGQGTTVRIHMPLERPKAS